VALKAKSLLASFCRSPVYRASALCDVGTACRSARVPFFLSLALGLELLQFFKGLFVRTLKVRFIVDRASQLLTKPRLLARLGLLVFVLECLAKPQQRKGGMLECSAFAHPYRRIFVPKFPNKATKQTAVFRVGSYDVREDAVLEGVPRTISLALLRFSPSGIAFRQLPRFAWNCSAQQSRTLT